MKTAERMMALFSGHTKAYGSHGEPEQEGLKWAIKRTARTLHNPVTLKLWQEHLAGKKPLGIIPIREDSTCLWGSIDVDDYAGDMLGIIDRVERAKLSLVPGQSKSGGLHLFCFLKKPVAAGMLQSALKNLAAQLGLAGSEIFPKQTHVISEKGDVGNWMVMPYFGQTYDGKLREQVGLRKTGAALTIEQFLDGAEAAKVDEATLQSWASQATRSSAVPKGGKKTLNIGGGNGEPFSDGPVCLQILAQEGVQSGGQSNALLNMGVYYKRKDPMGWQTALEQANRDFLTPVGSAEGLISVIKSLEKKDYQYGCKVEPMCSHCNATVCRTRKYGVGNENDFPAISGLSKLNTEPPLWFVDVDGARLEVSSDELLYYSKFIKVLMEKSTKMYNAMGQPAWQIMLRPLMETCSIIEAPSEVGRGGQFKELLEEFCTNRQKGRQKEDLLSGRPWESEEEKRHYFRLKDFQKFLVRENVKDYTRGQITQRLKHLNGGYKFMKIKHNGLNAWYVPSNVFEENAPIDIPTHEGDPI